MTEQFCWWQEWQCEIEGHKHTEDNNFGQNATNQGKADSEFNSSGSQNKTLVREPRQTNKLSNIEIRMRFEEC